MVARRRLIAPLGALAILPAACAEPSSTLIVSEPIQAPLVAPPLRPVVLTETSTPRLRPCREASRRAPHRKGQATSCLVVSRSVARPAVVAAQPPMDPSPVHFAVRAAVSATPALTASATSIRRPPLSQDRMDGAIKVFAYAPGRVVPVSAAPLRVTTLSLEPGETLIDKAAGDTVRWQIGETSSGSDAGARTLVMLKPLSAGLSTNLVLTTSRRVYLLDLSSTAHKADTAIAWSYSAAVEAPMPAPRVRALTPQAPPVALGLVSARYRITPVGRRPAWTPQSVFDDGQRTFIAFGPDLVSRSAPLLFAKNSDGEPQIVNYRKAGDLYIVDGLYTQLELRLGDRPAEVVRLSRLPSGGGA